MQTPSDVCPALAVLPNRLAWRVVAERAKHMGLKMSKCGFSSFNLFWALTWSARSPTSHPKRRSIATPTVPSCWNLAGECASASAQHHQLRAPRPPAWPLACCRQPPNWDRAAHLHDLRLCFMTSIFCTAFSLHFRGIHRLVQNLIGSRWHWDCCCRLCTCTGSSSLITCQTTLLSSVFHLLPSWRFQLRVVYGILQSVLELASPRRGIGTRGIPQSTPCFMRSALPMYRRRAFPIASEFERLSHSWVRPKVSLTQNSGTRGQLILWPRDV